MPNNPGHEEEEKLKIQVGKVKHGRESCTKLLGMKIEEKQKWNVHCKELVAALYQQCYVEFLR